MNTLHYRGYTGSVKSSQEDGCLYGELIGVKGLISYEGANIAELTEDFRHAVDDYLSVTADALPEHELMEG